MKKTYLTLFFLWIGHFLVDYMIGVWAVYKTIAGLDVAIAGLIAGLSALAGEGLQLVFGSLSDKGHRKLLIGAGLLTTTASALMAYTHAYGYLFLLFMLTCVGSGAFHPAAAGLVGMLSKKRKGLFLAIFMSGGALGLASSQLIFTSAYEYLQGQTALLAIPSICLVAFIAFYGLAEIPGPRILPGRGVDLKAFGKFFKHEGLRTLYLIQLFTQALFWGTIFLLPDLLTYRSYPEWVSMGGGHLFFILGGACMIVPGGYLSDYASPKRIVMVAQIATICLYAALLSFPLLPAPWLCALLFCLGSSFGVIQPLIVGMGTDYAPARPGMVSAFLLGLVWCVAEGLGQGVGGLFTKLFTVDPTAKAMWILELYMVLSFGFALKLPLKISDEEKCEFAV